MKPRLTTERDKIRGVADAWHETYYRSRGERWYDDEKRKIHERLQLLDLESCSAEDVRAVIGNVSWTQLHCDGCDKYVLAVVTVGSDPDYESNTAWLCRSCAEAALAAFDCIAHEDCAEHPTTLGRACSAVTHATLGE